jgi:hypothetical protein
LPLFSCRLKERTMSTDQSTAVEAGAATFPGWNGQKVKVPLGASPLDRAIADDRERLRLATNEQCRKLTRTILAAAAPLLEVQVRHTITAQITEHVIPGAVTRDYQAANAAYLHSAQIADGTADPTVG